MKSTQTKIIVTSLVFVFIIAAIIFFGIYPEIPKYSNNKSELSETKAMIEEADFKLSELNKLEKNSAEVTTAKEFVTGLLPENISTSDFVVKVEAMSVGVPVIVSTLSTGSSTPAASANKAAVPTQDNKGSDNSVDFSLTATIGYNTILEVIEKLESFPRFNILDSINLSGRDKETQTLDLQAKGRIFYGK